MENIGEPRKDGSLAVTWSDWLRSLGAPLAIDRHEWVAFHGGREIRVVTRGLFRADLLLDGCLVDRRHPWMATGRRCPFLSAHLTTRDAGAVVAEVFALDLLASRIEVRAAGKPLDVEPILDPS